MPTLKRKVIRIDEEKCDGCGLCVPSCAEGALQIIDGKAKLVSDKYCDGLGDCLGECPQDAIFFEERDAEVYDQEAVVERLKSMGREYIPHDHGDDGHDHDHSRQTSHAHAGGFSCPSARTLDFREQKVDTEPSEDAPKQKSELRQWPVKLNLVSPQAPYFQNADLLIAADCAPFAYASLHPDFLKGRTVVIGCPKFDDLEYYREKLTAIIKTNSIRSITVLHMEVPCCTGLLHIAYDAVKASGKAIPVAPIVVSLRGEVKQPTPAY
ncbi:MAG: 4Fe-4S dicluster domain-containing protein [Armatimonadota bacterium]|nr:4Fe-4S dicluster domain-containing protein [Armatimonadota bacterium]